MCVCCNISKSQIQKQGQKEKCCVGRISECKIRVVAYSHWCSHWIWRWQQRKYLISYVSKCNWTANLSGLILLASHVHHCKLCPGMLQEEARGRQVEEPKPSSPCCSDIVWSTESTKPLSTSYYSIQRSLWMFDGNKDLWTVLNQHTPSPK